MARRPVFVPSGRSRQLVDEVPVEFPWNPGFAAVQKKKNVTALHAAAERKGLSPLLEISTKSEDKLGQRLSAFSLKVETEIGSVSLEAAYQGSKVFESGGPYRDIYKFDSRTAKRDPRLRESGRLLKFDYFGQEWPLAPKTAFYDWLYLSALKEHKDYLRRLFVYDGFTDIEFNPEKSVSCQARSCALLVSLLKLNAIDEALRSQHDFIETISFESVTDANLPATQQGQMRL